MTLTFADPLLHLRSITVADEEALFQIYAGTRADELAQVANWSPDQKESFLRMQFRAQHTYYQANYKNAHFWVIVHQSQVIGRLYLHPHYEKESIRIIDISLLPGWRNKRIGTTILVAVMEYAESMNRSVTIHVESFNPAMKLYLRLGFVFRSQTNGVYHLLEWRPNTSALAVNHEHHQMITNVS